MQHHRAVLADGIEHHRLLALGDDLAHDVDALGFKPLKVGQARAGWLFAVDRFRGRKVKRHVSHWLRGIGKESIAAAQARQIADGR